jgi:hypothetical protein
VDVCHAAAAAAGRHQLAARAAVCGAVADTAQRWRRFICSTRGGCKRDVQSAPQLWRPAAGGGPWQRRLNPPARLLLACLLSIICHSCAAGSAGSGQGYTASVALPRPGQRRPGSFQTTVQTVGALTPVLLAARRFSGLASGPSCPGRSRPEKGASSPPARRQPGLQKLGRLSVRCGDPTRWPPTRRPGARGVAAMAGQC